MTCLAVFRFCKELRVFHRTAIVRGGLFGHLSTLASYFGCIYFSADLWPHWGRTATTPAV